VTSISIKITNLSKRFGDITVVNNISLSLPNSEIIGVLGKNGAGKTTFLSMLMGLINPTTGDIYIFNKSLKLKKYEILKDINFQSPYVELPKKMSVFQNLIFYARLYEVENPEKRILELSEDLSIKELHNLNYGTLSSGQKTRVNLCKSLLNNPKLLLLDEPTASLDVATSEFIRNYLIDFQKKNKATIIITSHDLDEIEAMCTHIIILDKGKIKYDGKKLSLFKRNNYSSLRDLLFNNDK
tara:strand:+ start:228 stop:950 length:723 start_codon:yes stop_codon:yes gene_type:complete